MKQTVGVLLAGGQSRRFGSPKAFATFEGLPFWRYSFNALRPYCDEVVVVTRDEFRDDFQEELRVTTDIAEFAGMGPLAGILSGMELVDAARYVVLPCDMPFMTRKVIAELLDKHAGDITAVVVEGKLHPLVSIWQAGVKPTIRQALRDGNRRVMDVQEIHHAQWVEGARLTDSPTLVFKNVNTPCELERG